ncbi:serine/threonine-protein kinase [Streptomyces sp. N2-109]|uniref:Serine/threonine-protein kinase n=1 Tax=Streptomyces gossypii TaxID=2883101 RepID=A0ABT2JV68_9ACTN|nr:serine/threonine-protein kinase [Streptomyces gossypii]MCT2591793.1 serine/threonine-protein kinase [Streptomyces gossypii]
MHTTARPKPLLPHDPESLGHWRLLGRLGAGGMGTVYLARSPGGRTVALKVVHPALAREAEFRARFREEVRTTRALLNQAAPGARHFAAVVDADTEGPRPWLATEYLLAPTLQDAVEAYGAWSPAAVRALGGGLAGALAAVHRGQLVHRDLKPSNVLVTADGPRVIDFGIALSEGGRRLTRTGYVLGSAAYMAPEQADGRASTPYSDVFALAGVIVFAATGRGPFGHGTSEELLYRVVHGQPELAELAAADPDGSLHRLLARALAKDPTERPSAAELTRLLCPEDVDAPPFSALLPAPVLADIAARTTLRWDVPDSHQVPEAAPADAPRPTGADAGQRTASGSGGTGAGARPGRRALLLGAAGTLALAAAAGTAAYAAGRAARPGAPASAGPSADGSPSPSQGAGGRRAKGTAPRPLWEYRGGLLSLGRPELAGDVLAARTETAGEMYGIDVASGSVRWSAQGVAGNHPVATPDGATVVLSALYSQDEDRLAFVATADGRTWYSDPLGVRFDRLAGSPAVAFHGRTLFAVGQRTPRSGLPGGGDGTTEGPLDRYLFAYDIDRARMLWQRAIAPGAAGSTSGVVSGRRLLLCEADTLRAYDLKDGSRLWETELLAVREDDDSLNRAVVSAGKHGVLVSGRELLLVDPADGRARWRLGEKSVRPGKDDPEDRHQGDAVFGAPAVSGGSVYATTPGQSVTAFDLATGRRRWRWRSDGQLGQPPAPVTVADGLVFPPLPGGRIVLAALDARTGKGTWRIRENEYSGSDTHLAADGKRLYAARGPHVLALPLGR